MLSGLFIQNLAVIEKVYIELNPGMNVFTGETGAGKSIVIDAINAILGGRCSKELVRTGEKKATIIASFRDVSQSVHHILEDYGLENNEDELVIQREIASDGKTSARVCGRPATVSMLKELGVHLIHIHGQHDNQLLLSPESHLSLLDNFGDLQNLRQEYQNNFTRLNKVQLELEALSKSQAKKAQKVDMLNFQINEIEQADLEPGEDLELENESRAIKNSSRILENLNFAYQALAGEDEIEGASSQLSVAAGSLEEASEYFGDLSELANRTRSLSYEAEEIQHELSSRLDEYDFNPNRLDAIEARLDEIFKLKRKYGSTVEEILAHLDQCRAQLTEVELYDVRQNEWMLEQQKLQKLCTRLANQLTQGRQAAARLFVKTVSEELKFLNMGNVTLQVQFEPISMSSNGQDKVQFLISTNVGEPPKPIAKIASGGELSRIMLAIQNALAEKDQVPTLIFDEVDTGVSGSAAQKIGLKLKQAAKYRQILSVTHLAQIAALADSHYRIQKSVRHDRTFTEVKLLDEMGRQREVARIMSTGEITDLMLQNAAQMIRRGREQ